jgi:asparagine synthase (glutamine-hydrolysing)
MVPYITLVWNENDPEHVATEELLEHKLGAVGRGGFWKCMWSAPGIAVFCPQAKVQSWNVCTMPVARGVIVGTVFRNAELNCEGGTPARRCEDAIDPDESARACQTAGRFLVEKFWGNYIAFLRASNTRKVVLRGPMASIPAYITEFRGVQICFSRLGDLLDLNVVSFTINWRFVEEYMLRALDDRSATGLNEVTQLRGGEAWEYGNSHAEVRDVWDPVRWCSVSSVESSVAAEHLLRNSIRMCTRAWAGCFGRVLMRLSGGLDSAIIASCLRDSPHGSDVIAINGFRSSAGSDERRYARAAAERAGWSLIEAPYPEEISFGEMWKALPFPFPPQTLGSLCSGSQERVVVKEHGIQAVFDGTDGDGLFGRSMSEFGAIDYAFRRGIRRGLLESALDTARMEHVTLWSMLWRALSCRFRRRWNPFGGIDPLHQFSTSHLLEARRSGEGFARWRAAEVKHGVSPVQVRYAQHVCSITSGGFDPFDAALDHPAQISPLCAQPVIEAALRIPLYLLTASFGSRLDRPLARRAFFADVPEEIIFRRDKGSVEIYNAALMRRNSSFLRGLLLDGYLVQKGYLKKPALEDALSDVPSGDHEGVAQVLWLACLEIWLQKTTTASAAVEVRNHAVQMAPT